MRRYHDKFQIYYKFIFKRFPDEITYQILQFAIEYDTNLQVVKSEYEREKSIERITGQSVCGINFGISQEYNFCGYYHSCQNSSDGDIDSCSHEARSCERLLAHIIYLPRTTIHVFMIVIRAFKNERQTHPDCPLPVVRDIICEYGYVPTPFSFDYSFRRICSKLPFSSMIEKTIQRSSSLIPTLRECRYCENLELESYFYDSTNENMCISCFMKNFEGSVVI